MTYFKPVRTSFSAEYLKMEHAIIHLSILWMKHPKMVDEEDLFTSSKKMYVCTKLFEFNGKIVLEITKCFVLMEMNKTVEKYSN